MTMMLVAVNDQPAPVIVHHQKACVRFAIVLHSEFNESWNWATQLADQVLNDSIFTPLTKDAKFGILKFANLPVGQLRPMQTANRQLKGLVSTWYKMSARLTQGCLQLVTQ